MPLGTSDGETFENAWEAAIAPFREGLQNTGLLRHEPSISGKNSYHDSPSIINSSTLDATPDSESIIRLAEATGQVLKAKAEHVLDLFKLAGDVYQGKIDPASDEAMNKATELAGLIGTGGLATAPAREGVGMFGGVLGAKAKAFTAGDTRAYLDYSLANKMEQKGFDPHEIQQATGWYRGTEGEWRFEIPDNNSFLHASIEPGKTYKLSEVYTHPELFKAYPQLKDLNVKFERDFNPNYAAYFDAGKNQIVIGPDNFINQESSLAHEVQHAIQNLEGFNKGTNPTARITEAQGDLLDKIIASEEHHTGDGALSELYQKIASLTPEQRQEFARMVYNRAPGEVEARLVQHRLDLTPEERKKLPPRIHQTLLRDGQLGITDPNMRELPLTREQSPGGSQSNNELSMASRVDVLPKAANDNSLLNHVPTYRGAVVDQAIKPAQVGKNKDR